MKRNEKTITFLFLSFLFLISCSKETTGKEITNKPGDLELIQSSQIKEETELNTQIEKKEAILEYEPTDEDVYPDLDRVFLYKDWHPLKQTDFIKGVKERIKNQEKKEKDDSLYDDEFTTEFSLHDETRNFCIYHNVRNIKNYSIDDFEIYHYVNAGNMGEFVWSFQETEGISVEWVDDSGAIVKIGTEDSRYSTKRGIKVGDSAEKIMEAYEDDCTVEEYNYDDEKWETVSEKEYPCMLLSKSNECISLNIGNDRAEGMMTLSYMLEDGVVLKIIIQGS